MVRTHVSARVYFESMLSAVPCLSVKVSAIAQVGLPLSKVTEKNTDSPRTRTPFFILVLYIYRAQELDPRVSTK